MKSRHGVKLADGTVMLKGNPQQPKRMSCMSCHCEAHEVTRPDGKRLYKCIGCGREWTAVNF
jgi:flavoprotein